MPVTTKLDVAVAPAKPMCWFKFSNGAVSRQRRRDAHEREVVIERLVIDIATDVGMKQQGFEFRTKHELPVYVCIKQRLFTDEIARQKQLLLTLVPDREDKHSTQMFGTINAKLIVGMNDRFGVAVGVEGVAEVLKLLAQLEIVIDLAIEHDP